jgi:ribosomal protein L9
VDVSHAEDFLAHFGVKGMKWGVRRKSKVPASSDAQKSLDIRKKAKQGKAKALTNAELQTAINRMNLEQQFKRLSVNERPPVQRWIASTLLEVGKREVQVAIAKKVTSTIAKKVATGGVA